MISLPQSVSLVMRSYNEAWALGHTLDAVYSQDFPGSIELIVIDSGSTDGSHAIIESHHPKEFIILKPNSYVPGKVLNQGLRLATNEWVVFLNSDATPANQHWLSELLKTATQTPQLGAAFSRQIPRPDCLPLFAHDYDRCFGPNRESIHWDHFFSMVSCIVHKPTWEKHPIREDLQYAEDDEWSRRLINAGYTVAFAEKSIAIHSHNYTPKESYKRSKGDALAVAQAGNIQNCKRAWHRDVFLPAIKDTFKDLRYAKTTKQNLNIISSYKIRYQQRLGRLHGYQEGISMLQNNSNSDKS